MIHAWSVAVRCTRNHVVDLSLDRVYDNAKANAVMQKAITIIGIEEGLSHRKREKFRHFIHDENSPRVRFYDDDDAEPGGDEDLQKVTIMIKVRTRCWVVVANGGRGWWWWHCSK